MGEIVNKIKQSKLETVDLETLLGGEQVALLDIKPFLFKELLLKEKEYREHIEQHDWEQYEGKWLAVTCSSDAIVPHWAWMLVATKAAPYVRDVTFGDEETARMEMLKAKMEEHDWQQYEGKFILLKGCSKMKVPAGAYLEATKKLLPVVGKLMYGEACSNVPVYRKPRNRN